MKKKMASNEALKKYQELRRRAGSIKFDAEMQGDTSRFHDTGMRHREEELQESRCQSVSALHAEAQEILDGVVNNCPKCGERICLRSYGFEIHNC